MSHEAVTQYAHMTAVVSFSCPGRQWGSHGKRSWRGVTYDTSTDRAGIGEVRGSPASMGWKHSQTHPPQGHHCIVSRKQSCFLWLLHLLLKLESHLGMSKWPPPLPFLLALPPAALCNVALGRTWKHLSLHHQHSLAHPSRRTTCAFPPSRPQFSHPRVHLCLSALCLSCCLVFFPLLSFRNI